MDVYIVELPEEQPTLPSTKGSEWEVSLRSRYGKMRGWKNGSAVKSNGSAVKRNGPWFISQHLHGGP